ncbi:MAG: tyrosine-type recombinase/integrase [Alphaproteobacteria bacterium]|nr:tyrosine-type recombinase/integrase [Alphaproteobacteria bacterium]
MERARRAAWIQRFTALRISEALQLRWEDVDLDRAELMVRTETSKGGYFGRVLPMSAFLVAEMRGWSRSDAVVCTEMGFRARTGSRPARVFTTACRRAPSAPRAGGREQRR